jgi:hypothetical protein
MVFFLLFEKKKMPRECLKQKGRSARVEVGAKNEKAEQELEGKLPPFSALFFFLYGFFSFF